MNVLEPSMPESEAALLAVLLKLPYLKRTGYVLRLVNTHRNDPALLSLIQELLSTTLLPDRVPFPGEKQGDSCITLLFPQSTASKRFLQRELGLAMASALGQPAVPFLLDAISHQSTAGKSRAITACTSQPSGATDKQLVEVYRMCVPATQESLRTAMETAGRVEALKILQLWNEPPLVKIPDPRCIVLERDLKIAKPRDRDAIWSRAGLSLIRPDRRQHDPVYILKDSKVGLVTTLFNLLELYPPPHLAHPFKLPQDIPSIPSSLDKRIHSFLLCDLPRTLRLLRRACHIPDPEHKGRDLLRLPSSFMHQRSSTRFWHRLSLEEQTEHLLPFILELMQVHNHALLKNGQLLSANLLQNARWPIVIGVVEGALSLLNSTQSVQSMSNSERNGVVAFIVYAIDNLVSRLNGIAYREDKPEVQMEVEHGLNEILRRSVKCILAASQVSASSDEAFVTSFMQHFVLTLLRGQLRRYPPLVELLFDSIRGVFDIAQVSKSELVSSATQFFLALQRKRLTIFDIPNDGVVYPYCGIREKDNESVFHLLLRLENPVDNPFLYLDILLGSLSKPQQEVIWSYLGDPKYIYGQLRDDGTVENLSLFVKILRELPSSPRARLHIVKGLLNHAKMDSHTAANVYSLLDISDAPSREVLEKNTYKRLFTDRYQAYQHLMTATWAQESPTEYIKTMRFLIPRIKNEILPDAQQIPGILDKNGVGDILRLLDHATDEEAKQLAELYLAWEKQNNEAVSRVIFISDYILDLANSALNHFAGSPTHPFFHFGMDLLWAREVFMKGSLKAHETYNIQFSMNLQYKLTEEEELKKRQFIIHSKDALGEMGYWRIIDEQQFVDTLLKQYQKIHQTVPFDHSTAYPTFISNMLKVLGTRWVTVNSLHEYTERQLDVLRRITGSNKQPADWSKKPPQEAIQYILLLRTLYHNDKATPETLPWWFEFRHMRLFSTHALAEVDLLHRDTFDSEGKQSLDTLDLLVEKLLNIDDSAVYLEFVRNHLMENRQDILKDSHVTGALVGLFNQLPDGAVPHPPTWHFTSTSTPRRLYPHQCQIFAAKLLETIRSEAVPLHSQVRAAEQLTKLPTTTIIELAELLKEDLNQRVVEAILMFLPHLDEPASGIQFLLAPTYLDGDLARTVAFSVRNSLQHVPVHSLPKVLVSAFPPENSTRVLKVTVMKEFVRLLCQHISHEEHQSLLMTLWRRKLHQDVRIALLQSVISMLGSKQEDLAWTILRDAISNPAFVLDDALFVLLAVNPAKPSVGDSDVHIAHISDPDVITEMAQNTIPELCHDAYTESVLFPLAQLPLQVPEVSLQISEKDAKLVGERLRLLQQSAYHAIFSRFLTTSNAQLFAKRGLDAATNLALSEAQGFDLFPYFVYGIGKCVALDAQCWEVLCQLVDFLASAVGGPAREPTRASLKAVQRLRAMNLGYNMTFQRPELIAKRLTVDRMSLLDPLVRRGCDHFAVTFWERRFYLFSCERRRILSENQNAVLPSELDEARSILLDLTRLAGELQYDLAELKSKTVSLIDATSDSVANTLVEDLLSGNHGLGDVVWINELRLLVLSRRLTKSRHVQSYAAFQTQVSDYHKSFYARHRQEFRKLVQSTLKSDSRPESANKELVPTLLDPIFDRAESSSLDSLILRDLLDNIPDIILRHRPQWALDTISKTLFNLPSWEIDHHARLPAILLIEFVNTTSIQGNSTASKMAKPLGFTPLTALLVEAINSGTLRDFNLAKIVDDSTLKAETVLEYPYFVTGQDDGSGGDIEDRRSKSSIAQLLDRYQGWREKYASRYLSNITHQAQIPPSCLAILGDVLGRFPKLALVHPSLFLSYAALTFGSSDLDTTTKIHNVISHIQNVLTPNRQGESGTRWGWAPPISLALSFAEVLFTETANEVTEGVLDDCSYTGSWVCKLAALQLLEWWASTFYDARQSDQDLAQLAKTMERGEGREAVMRQYDELRVRACRDESRAVRERAFSLKAGDSLVFGL